MRYLATILVVIAATACGEEATVGDNGENGDGSPLICGEADSDATCAYTDACNCWAPDQPCCDEGLYCFVAEPCNVETENGCTTVGTCTPKRVVDEVCQDSSDCLDEDAACTSSQPDEPGTCSIVLPSCKAANDTCTGNSDCCSGSCLGFSGFTPGYCG